MKLFSQNYHIRERKKKNQKERKITNYVKIYLYSKSYFKKILKTLPKKKDYDDSKDIRCSDLPLIYYYIYYILYYTLNVKIYFISNPSLKEDVFL